MDLQTVWFIILAFMLIAYVILDGFDMGAGVIHLLAAKSPAERRAVLAAIGPVWDGNEVWLIAAGGVLFFAFPGLYASSFSGFYLPLILVLWLLVFRALGIEFRNHIRDEMWHSFFDAAFAVSSALLSIFFGAALGNVVRGVPLEPTGYFFEPLWTDFTPSRDTGILDWYTVLTGITAVVVLSGHGATYIAAKSEGAINLRARRIAGAAWWGTVLLTLAGLVATLAIRPELLANFRAHPGAFAVPASVFLSLAGMAYFLARGRDTAAFLASSLYIAAMLSGAALALYPVLLPATTDPALSLTIYNSAAPRYGLAGGLAWWSIGIILALAYNVIVYSYHRGKVRVD